MTIYYQELELTIDGDCATNSLTVGYNSAVSGSYRERKYCSDPLVSEPSLNRLVSANTVFISWRKTEPSNSFKLTWVGQN